MINQFTTVAKTSSGIAYLSEDRKTLAVCFSTLADTKGAAELMKSAREVVILNQVQVFVTDAQGAEGASFDAIWRVEECLSNLRRAESIREWRHVPSDSVVLQTALRRMVRQVQAQGLFCGVYASLDAALAARDGCLIEGQDGMLNSPTGVVAHTGRYILAELRDTVPDSLLDVHMDVLSYALQGSATQRVVLRLLPGTRVSRAGLLNNLGRVLNIGSNPLLMVVDEAGVLEGTALPAVEGGICHVCRTLAEADASMTAITLDRFRLGAAREAMATGR